MIESKSLFSFVLFFLASYGISFNYTLSFSFFFLTCQDWVSRNVTTPYGEGQRSKHTPWSCSTF
jgi:hypothetical protein